MVSKKMEPNTVLFNDSILELNINEKRLFHETVSPDQSRIRSQISYHSAMHKASQREELSNSKMEVKPRGHSPSTTQGPMITVPKMVAGSTIPKSQRTGDDRISGQDKTERIDTSEQFVRKFNQKYVEVVNSTVKRDAEFLKLRSLNLMAWGDVEETINKIVELASDQRILTFRIYFDKLQPLSKLMREPSEAELIACIENFAKKQDFLKKMFNHSNQSGAEAMWRVAIKIQKNFKKMIARRMMAKLTDIQKKIKMIQFQMRLKYIHRETVAKTRERNLEKYQRFIDINSKFMQDWDQIAGRHRVEIHINSLSRPV
jgi:hypothetical protein